MRARTEAFADLAPLLAAAEVLEASLAAKGRAAAAGTVAALRRVVEDMRRATCRPHKWVAGTCVKCGQPRQREPRPADTRTLPIPGTVQS